MTTRSFGDLIKRTFLPRPWVNDATFTMAAPGFKVIAGAAADPPRWSEPSERETQPSPGAEAEAEAEAAESAFLNPMGDPTDQ